MLQVTDSSGTKYVLKGYEDINQYGAYAIQPALIPHHI